MGEESEMNDAPRLGANPVSTTGNVSSILTGAATSHTVALIRMGEDGKITYGGDSARIHELVSKLAENPRQRAGCRRPLADGQWWTFCGEADMGHTLPVLCTECGGTMQLA